MFTICVFAYWCWLVEWKRSDCLFGIVWFALLVEMYRETLLFRTVYIVSVFVLSYFTNKPFSITKIKWAASNSTNNFIDNWRTSICFLIAQVPKVCIMLSNVCQCNTKIINLITREMCDIASFVLCVPALTSVACRFQFVVPSRTSFQASSSVHALCVLPMTYCTLQKIQCSL